MKYILTLLITGAVLLSFSIHRTSRLRPVIIDIAHVTATQYGFTAEYRMPVPFSIRVEHEMTDTNAEADFNNRITTNVVVGILNSSPTLLRRTHAIRLSVQKDIDSVTIHSGNDTKELRLRSEGNNGNWVFDFPDANLQLGNGYAKTILRNDSNKTVTECIRLKIGTMFKEY